MRRVAGATFGALCAALAVAGVTGAAGPEDSVSGSGKGTFKETGGPFHLSVGARGTEADVNGHVRGTGDVGLGEFRLEGRPRASASSATARP